MSTQIAAQEINQLGTELISTIATRWIEVGQNFAGWQESKDGLCTKRVREIGEQINRIGGFSAMTAVCAEAGKRFRVYSPDLEVAFNAEIAWAWNGIGDWQA